MELFRVKAWQGVGPKRRRGEPRRAGVVSAGYKAPEGRHTVMLAVATVPEHDEWSDNDIIAALVNDHGLVPIDAEVRAKWEAIAKEAPDGR